MGENVNVKRTIEDLDQRQEEWKILSNELKEQQKIEAEKKLLVTENEQEPEQ